MDHKEFCIVSALARASMGNPNCAIINHITKLKQLFEERGDLDKANSLMKILDTSVEVPKHKVILSETVGDGG